LEEPLSERGTEISHETVRFWWNRLESQSAAEIRKKKVSSNRRGYLEEVIVKTNCETYYSSWAVDHERGRLGEHPWEAP
jgi:putative transposase